ARPDSGDDGHDGARHDDEWNPLIAGLMAAEKRRRQESYGLDAINSSSSVATLETRRALQGSLRDEFIDHK
ncbi:unnamed protein product, partial [Brassica rapa subsp. narinosa]